MDEATWLTTTDPVAMLTYLHAEGLKPRERQLRLLLCAYCRCCWSDCDGLMREVVEVAERHVDGAASEDELRTVRESLLKTLPTREQPLSWETHLEEVCCNLSYTDHRLNWTTTAGHWGFGPGGWPTICGLVRELFANPFRPVVVDPSWLRWQDGVVARLARSVYDDRHFDELPVLADALEDAGCGNADLLAHLRSLGPHALGCWALDALLGKG